MKYLCVAGSASGKTVRNHSSVEKISSRKNPELFSDKNKDDWNMNEDDHTAGSAASTSDLSQPFNDTEISRVKKSPELASGEPPIDSHQLTNTDEEYDSLRGRQLHS